MTATREQAQARYEWLTNALSDLLRDGGEHWSKGRWDAFNSIRNQQAWLEKILGIES